MGGQLPLSFYSDHQEQSRPDITVMVDWALKINYLSIYPVYRVDNSQWFRESEFKSEDSGFDPLAGQGEGESLIIVQTCLCLNPPPPPLPHACVRHAPEFVRTLKIPYQSVVKE